MGISDQRHYISESIQKEGGFTTISKRLFIINLKTLPALCQITALILRVGIYADIVHSLFSFRHNKTVL